MKHDFLTTLKNTLIIADGGMGSLLYANGINPRESLDHLNLTNPGLVSHIHDQFLDAGARLIETNTFSANRFKLQKYGLDTKVREINRKGAELAVACARKCGDKAWVAGSMGPLGRFDGQHPSPDAMDAAYREQAEALVEGGVDLLVLETFCSLNDLLSALGAIRQHTTLPIMTQLTFERDGKTLDGAAMIPAFRLLQERGADVVGANCGLGPLGLASIIELAGRVLTCPVSVFPNAGLPEKIDDRLVSVSDPDYFAKALSPLVESGINIIGGCCGTTPDHIRALTEETAQLAPGPKPPVPQSATEVTEVQPPRSTAPKSATTPADPAETPRIIVELDPPKHLDLSHVITGATHLKNAGVDFISIAENPLGVHRLSNVVMSRILKEKVGVNTIVHLTGRDRNLIGMQSTLMGLATEGAVNILAVTGDPPPSGSEDKIKGVFDLRAYEMIALLDRMKRGEDFKGNDLKSVAKFSIGAAFNPNTRNMDFQVKRLKKKIELGAEYVQTQPVYTKDKIDEVAEKTKGLDIPIYLGILPLVSSKNAEFLHNEFPGITIPDDVRQRMKDAGDNGVSEGIDIAGELIDYARDRFAGFFIMPPFNRYQIALELVKKINKA